MIGRPWQREVIPVDTHVHQIAIKHYGLRSPNGKAKSNMTPRLYDEVSTKLVTVWGEYAGWAHSVSPTRANLLGQLFTLFVGPVHVRLEIFLVIWASVAFTNTCERGSSCIPHTLGLYRYCSSHSGGGGEGAVTMCGEYGGQCTRINESG
jgi:hypothetical protein